jgi:hypothetical protein
VSEQFRCSVCGREHEGIATDQAYQLPDDVWNIPEQERADRARFDSDLCRFGKRFFIRGLLPVPFVRQSGDFGWGVWVEVSWITFQRYLELYEHDGSFEPAQRGILANDLLAYPSSVGSEVDITFRDASARPTFRLLDDDESALAKEQRRGISDARYHQILNLIETTAAARRA